ncbi:MAG: HAAS signaling domain-containing protein [Pseudomonadota bacterium]
MDMVERYIAAVQRELPEKKRDDIGRELKANILDQIEALEAQQGSVSDAEVAELLKTMGHPRRVALQFCPPTPLVTAQLMPLYLHTLYMVLGVLFVISTIEITSRWLGGTEMSLLLFMKGLASDFLASAYFAFTAITIGFAVMSRSRKKETAEVAGTCKWSPDKLPLAGKSWQYISLQDIFTELATLLALVMLIWYPLWQPDSGAQSIFTGDALTVLSWFTPVIVIAIAHNLWQLRTRLWNRSMLMLNIGVNTAFLIASIVLLTKPVLQINDAAWRDGLGVTIAERSIQVLLVTVALIVAYEIVRDTRRLLRN